MREPIPLRTVEGQAHKVVARALRKLADEVEANPHVEFGVVSLSLGCNERALHTPLADARLDSVIGLCSLATHTFLQGE